MVDIMVSNMSMYFGDTPILLDIDFEIYEGRHVGLIGRNGSGKTTLFRVITGEYTCDSGNIVIPQSKKLGVLTQIPRYAAGMTVESVLRTAFASLDELSRQMEETAAKMAEGDKYAAKRYGELSTIFENSGGYTTDVELSKVTAGLNISLEMLAREFSVLSGGEQTRVNLARMILEKTDILLLDEPTNHLDIKSVEWLEDFLADFRGTAFIISHDRYFLDKTVNMIIELERLHAEVYNGNYSFYATEKQRRLDEQAERYQREQKDIKRLEFTSDRMHGWGMGNSKMMRRAFALDKRIERMRASAVEKVSFDKKLKSSFKEAARSGNDVCYVRELSKSFDGKALFSDLSFDVKKDESIALIGDNGTGKSTLLKLLLGELEPDCGRIRWGSNVKTAYLPQLVTFSNDYNSVLDETMQALNITAPMAKNRLAAYHFTGDDLSKLILDLSGGEKSRLRLCILMFSEINLLILDEPTNHLDIPSREWMEEALETYEGTLLFVSHDRYFVNRFATRIIELTGDGTRDFGGTYEEYREYLRKMEQREAAAAELADTSESKREKKAVPQDKKNSKGNLRRRAVLERDIENMEQKLSQMDNDIDTVATDHEALTKLLSEKDALQQQIDEMYAEWEAMY